MSANSNAVSLNLLVTKNRMTSQHEENAMDRIVGTAILWILIPIAVHILNFVKISTSNLSITSQPFEHQNEVFEWYVNILNLLRPSLEVALVHLGLVLVGIVLTLVSLKGILRPICTIVGILFAMWLSNVIGLDAFLVDYTYKNSPVPINEKTIEGTDAIVDKKEIENKLVCFDTKSSTITQILSKYSISKIITYNCKLTINGMGSANLTCPNDSTGTYEFDSIMSFETTRANLLVTDSGDMIQFKHEGISKTCFDPS